MCDIHTVSKGGSVCVCFRELVDVSESLRERERESGCV